MNLGKLVENFHSEEKCREYLEALRWPQGVQCPRCEGKTISRIHEREQFDCDSCRYQFSVTSGTIFHDTHLPLWKWFLAVYMMVESKKGISASQLQRTLAVAYRTAWYLCHRIRKALQTPHALLTGIVEVDETYVGGKVSGKGRGYKGNKTIVAGAVERGGKARLETINQADRKTLRQFILENVAEDAAAIFTDDLPAYGDLSDPNTRHETVNHTEEEWVRGDVHTNSVEGVWSLFKRSLIGAHHKVSKKHLDRYLDELEFRFNNRRNPYIFRDALRELVASGNMEYKELISGPRVKQSA
jgi:transposase-like protein